MSARKSLSVLRTKIHLSIRLIFNQAHKATSNNPIKSATTRLQAVMPSALLSPRDPLKCLNVHSKQQDGVRRR